MDRLTGRAPDGTAYLYNMGGANEAIDCLAAYEDTGLNPEEIMADMPDITAIEAELDRYKCAEAEGRLLLLPCEVGNTVWFIRPLQRNPSIEETQVEKVGVRRTGMFIKLSCNAVYETSVKAIGKSVFITREEAEAALRKEAALVMECTTELARNGIEESRRIMYKELIQRLRDSASGIKSCDECNGECYGSCLFEDAADAIESLIKRVQQVGL